MLRRITLAVSLLGLVAGMASSAAAAPRDTTVRTIEDGDGDNLLEHGPGEDYTVMGAPQDFRPPRNSIINFLQLSDFQIVDEESPGRVEFLDTTQRIPDAAPFSAAYRPQESLTTQIAEAMVRQARNTVSKVTGAKLDLTILTGDNADSQQYNETRWFIDILDGHQFVDPNSGVPTPACPGSPDSVYDGVQGGGNAGYFDPDASGPGTDGDGYSPDRQENEGKTGRDVTVRDFPGLFQSANDPFRSLGLDMPWYSAFGNHDALIQGNSPDAYLGPNGPSGETSNPAYQSIATGCFKPVAPATTTDPTDLLGSLLGAATTPVPPDARRCYLAKDEAGIGAPAPCSDGGWIDQHFMTTGEPAGHGFAPSAEPGGYGLPASADLNNDGYYSFSPADGLRFVVLDTITDECGPVPVCSEGSVDDAQFQWLKTQVETAATQGEYVMVFSHHTLRTTRFPSTDPTEDPIHYGQRVDRSNPGNPQNASPGQTLEELYCLNPNVIAHIAGHEHENYVFHYKCDEDSPPTAGPGEFWHVSTSAHIDYPQQARTIELIDNGDGTMSLVLTMLDHAGPPNPGGAKPDLTPNGAAGDSVLRLASIGREIGYNDYQGSRSAKGQPDDRNVIIVVPRAWPYSRE